MLVLVAAIIVLLIGLPRDETPKEEIIQSFIDNYALFMPIVEFAKNTDGNLYVDAHLGKWNITIENTGNEDAIEDMSIEVHKDINKIIRKLQFMGIYECDEGGEGQIEFVRDAGNFEQGIIYFDHPINTDYLLDIKLIRENWYYYMTIHE